VTEKRWFQTTAIDYPNSRPHIGTAFEKVGADVQARYRRMEGYDVCFLMGNDENTVKVSKRAEELGQNTQAYCDDMARQFREVWDALDVSYDVFLQTSHERHKAACRKFIQKVYDNGHIYKGSYEGWYCEGCEEFKTEKQHQENAGLCPTHKTPLARRSEPCYFFKLSAFQDRLLKHYEDNPHFIQPESRRNEIVSLIKNEGLFDVNISRRGQEWGIPIPFDPEFTIYVWFDALLTYISGIGYGDDEATFRQYWSTAETRLHFIGKDITRFHTALWPAMLWAAGEEAPRQVFAHGFVYVKNEEAGTVEKISKSLGNVVEPMEVISKFSSDAFRYYFMRECPFGGDGNFSDERFAEVYNADLANNLGNLLSRVATVVGSKCDGVGPEPPAESPLAALADEVYAESSRAWANVQPSIALEATWRLIRDANAHLEANEPWKADPGPEVDAVLGAALEVLRIVAVLATPAVPQTCAEVWRRIGLAGSPADERLPDAVRWGGYPGDLPVEKGAPLFPRIKDVRE
jgi:methionyl-tRNA synthetase